MALGLDGSGPIGVEGKQLVKMIPGGYTAASEYEVKYTYANGVVHHCKSTTASEWHGGSQGSRGPAARHQIHRFRRLDLGHAGGPSGPRSPGPHTTAAASAPRVYVSNEHMGNFIDCVKSRAIPICPAKVGHRSASLCHLGVTAIRLGRKLAWNPIEEQFVGDAEANRYVARPMRKPYDYDMI